MLKPLPSPSAIPCTCALRFAWPISFKGSGGLGGAASDDDDEAASDILLALADGSDVAVCPPD